MEWIINNKNKRKNKKWEFWHKNWKKKQWAALNNHNSITEQMNSKIKYHLRNAYIYGSIPMNLKRNQWGMALKAI